MLTITALTLKKTITLFALVGPVTMVPLFLATTQELDLRRKADFARTIGLSVTIALLVAGFLGMPLLGFLGVSLGAMRVGGGIIIGGVPGYPIGGVPLPPGCPIGPLRPSYPVS